MKKGRLTENHRHLSKAGLNDPLLNDLLWDVGRARVTGKGSKASIRNLPFILSYDKPLERMHLKVLGRGQNNLSVRFPALLLYPLKPLVRIHSNLLLTQVGQGVQEKVYAYVAPHLRLLPTQGPIDLANLD